MLSFGVMFQGQTRCDGAATNVYQASVFTYLGFSNRNVHLVYTI